MAYALLVVVAASAGSDPVRAADRVDGAERMPLGNRVFLEAFGSGLLYSLNYEITLSDRAGVRIGFGGLPISGVTYIVGLGMPTILIGNGRHMGVIAAGAGIGWIEDIGLFETQEAFVAYGVGSLGYQFQPRARGVFVRGCFTPVLTDGGLSPWGGVSIGAAL